MEDVTAAGSGGAGLGTAAARWALIAVWALGTIAGLLQGDFDSADPPYIAAHLLALPACVLLTAPGNRTLSTARACGVVGFAAAAVALLLAGSPVAPPPWAFSFSAYLVALLIARGNTMAGAGGGAILISLGTVWAWADGWSPVATFALVGVPIAALFGGAIWRLVLLRTVAHERSHRSEQARAALAAEFAEQSTARDREELAEVLVQVGPLLEAIAQDRELDAPFRFEIGLVEASLRDRIRSPWARHPRLIETIAARRRTGVEVLLLGERETSLGDDLALAAAGLIAHAERGDVTIHAAPPGRDHALSVLLRDGSRSVRVQLAEDGAEAGRR